jgi:hypothetical protein
MDHGLQKRTRRSKAEIQELKAGFYDILEGRHPQTDRQVFYQAVKARLIQKTETEYKNVVIRLLGLMREQDELPWEWIIDATRWMRKPTSYSSLEEAVRITAITYRRDLWANQNAYCEVWCEKEALAGVLYEITEQFDVPLMVAKGFSSKAFLHGAAKAIEASGKPAFLYYVGDHDPSGGVIWKNVQTKIQRYAPSADVTFELLAVTPEQIRQYALPTRPTKREHNMHAKEFKGRSVEVDALPVEVLQRLVRKAIEQHIDQRQLAITQAIEQSERGILQRWHLENSGTNPKSSVRVELTREGKCSIVERAAKGESQRQIAADFGVAESTIFRVLAKEAKRKKKGGGLP